MQIIADTREDNVLNFPKQFEFISNVVREKLDVGDYAARFNDGFVPPYFIERKAIGDLFGTLTQNYERFKKEIERAIETNVILVIAIEESLTEVRRGYTYPKRNEQGQLVEYNMTGEPRIKQLMTLWARYGIDCYFFTSRSEMAYWIYRRFCAIGELYIQDKLGFKNASTKKIRELL